MSEERLRVLKMVDERKISIEEAKELLLTIQKSDYRYVESGNRVIKKPVRPSFLEISIDENGAKIDVSIRIII
ncbi:MAG TPA: hypothetical protein VJ907_04745 [Halanaerobiales bacterium]|nr:hypothetical protein [Halanaerobiales bacterium]